MKSQICAIYTAYHPDKKFISRIEPIRAHCKSIIIVDNTPGGSAVKANENIIVIENGKNLGLPNALNIGVRKARELGCEILMFFDQDSTPDNNYVESIVKDLVFLENETNKMTHICVGPTHIDDQSPKRPASTLEFQRCTQIATSGMTIRLPNKVEMIEFNEDLFLDFVDFDWCWRAGLEGWSIYRSSKTQMLHRLGLGERVFLGIRFHVPAPFRHYYQFRDTLYIATKPYTPAYPRIRLLSILIPKLFIYPIIMDRGLTRLKWMLLGCFGYCLGDTHIGRHLRPLLNPQK